jgi:hypothetical protein
MRKTLIVALALLALAAPAQAIAREHPPIHPRPST